VAADAALNAVPYLRAKASGLARADWKARKQVTAGIQSGYNALKNLTLEVFPIAYGDIAHCIQLCNSFVDPSAYLFSDLAESFPPVPEAGQIILEEVDAVFVVHQGIPGGRDKAYIQLAQGSAESSIVV
jgi:hypothetical protein